MQQQHKYNYGIIGNCAFLALVDDKANIGWLCWPKFDSSFVFGNILDDDKGGQYSIQPEWDNYQSTQAYLTNTNILETTFHCEDGSFKVIDFAPRFFQYERYYKPLMLVRKIIPIDGRPRVRVTCKPVGNYGKTIPKRALGSSHIRYQGLDSELRLTSNISLNFIEDEQAFLLNEPKYLVMTWGVPLEAALESTVDSYLEKTKKYWQTWVRSTSIQPFHQEAVIRSALSLKLHQYQDTGAIIAAATTSLPEFPKSARNWDYRFCWLRDAHYTLKALHDLSHFGIVRDFSNFVENIAINEDGRFHPFYPIAMGEAPKETIIPLKGYQGERPVRVGNQAYHHTQNDVYGQILLTLLPLFFDKRLANRDNTALLEQVMNCLQLIEMTMEEPDNGLWEFRGIHQLHCYTFLFHWVGSMAARKIAKLTRHKNMEAFADQLIEKSAEMIERCYDEERGVYTQAIGSSNLDASTLQLINMGYLNPDTEKARKHVAVLEEGLKTTNGLFYRYKHVDDFGKPESTFLICAFWYVEVLVKMNRLDEAIEIFNQLQKYGNHLGLLSENVHAETGGQYGNFPQTYNHVGLINAALAISRKMDKPVYL